MAVAAKSPQVSIREAQRSDLPRLMELYRQLALVPEPDPTPEQQEQIFREISADRRLHLMVAQREGGVVGTYTLFIAPNLYLGGAPWAVVENVVVAAEQRGRGVGTAMMRHALEQARAAGCHKVSLTSNVVRANAHRFYRRLGWQRTHYGFTFVFEGLSRGPSSSGAFPRSEREKSESVAHRS